MTFSRKIMVMANCSLEARLVSIKAKKFRHLWEKGMYPFLLLDGHQSRFDIKFLCYVNDPKTKWSVCIGVPYGMAIWQVSELLEQKGNFKMRLSKEKKRIFRTRIQSYNRDLRLLKTDILPIVRKTFHESFN